MDWEQIAWLTGGLVIVGQSLRFLYKQSRLTQAEREALLGFDLSKLSASAREKTVNYHLGPKRFGHSVLRIVGLLALVLVVIYLKTP